MAVKVIPVNEKVALPEVLRQAVGCHHRPTLVLVGGASKLSDEDLQRVQAVFTNVLAPLAEQFGLIVVDGGTDAGVMQLMGNARMSIAGTFPLIGVAPAGLVNLPGQPASCEDAADLEPHHTHCLLIPGSHWGDESPWMAEVATLLAADHSSVVMLINGGSITWVDARVNVESQRPVVVLAGSGRAADVLAQAIAGEPVEDERAQPLVASGLLSSVELHQANSMLPKELKRLLRLG
ncbi:MAG: hypothetical protein F6K30_15475 [Cyanothece sp. SIO2G6]|nr:hypothetical protein [Cyanothece sp. SIO2G6]